MKTKSTRRLRARAAAMHPSDSEFDDYGPEPNMKLSHAFLVVLLLHVIAVGGLYAFNTMKAGKSPKPVAAKTAASSEQPTDPGDQSNRSEGQEPKQEDPKKRPPVREKAPVVAKTSEGVKTATQNDPKVVRNDSVYDSVKLTSPTSPHQGFLANAKAALQRVTGMVTGGAGAATLSTAVAQESDPGTVNLPVDTGVSAATTAKTYLVKSGDTITRIASTLGVTILDLEKANGLVGNAVLRVGQTLKVPEKVIAQASVDAGNQASQIGGGIQQLPGTIASAVTSPANVATNTPAVGAEIATYTIVKGDNPYKIAKKFKITPDELMKANAITDPKKIQIGQILKIPATSKKAAQ